MRATSIRRMDAILRDSDGWPIAAISVMNVAEVDHEVIWTDAADTEAVRKAIWEVIEVAQVDTEVAQVDTWVVPEVQKVTWADVVDREAIWMVEEITAVQSEEVVSVAVVAIEVRNNGA